MNQHYVPRAYLKNFSTKVGKEFFIDVFDKIENRYFKANIKKVCSETDLYTLSNDTTVTKDILAIEKVYGEHIEPMYSRAYEILTNDNLFIINDMQRIEIILGVLHFRMRNPKILKNALAYHKKIISDLYKEAKNKNAKGLTYDNEDFSFREYSLEQIIHFYFEKIVKLFKERHIVATAKIGQMHEFAKLEVSIAQADSSFITSDNPLAAEDYMTKLENPLARSSEFTFPLDRKHMLRIFHDNAIKSNQIRRQIIPNGSVHILNSVIYKQSSRFLFGSKEVFEKYNELENFLDDKSGSLIMNIIEELTNNAKVDSDNIEAYNIVRDFYIKHKELGSATHEEQQLMMRKVIELAIEFRNKKLH